VWVCSCALILSFASELLIWMDGKKESYGRLLIAMLGCMMVKPRVECMPNRFRLTCSGSF